MRKDEKNNFWSKFFKVFFIWEFITFIFRGFLNVCKLILLGFKQLIWLIAIGIKKITPIIKEKISGLQVKFNTIYRTKIKRKLSQFTNFTKKCKDKLKNKLIIFVNKHKTTRNIESMKKIEKDDNRFGIKIRLKKIKYSFL